MIFKNACITSILVLQEDMMKEETAIHYTALRFYLCKANGTAQENKGSRLRN